MFPKLLSYSGRTLFLRLPFRDASTAAAAWDLVTGVCVERLPVVTAPLTPLQATYKQLLDKIEIENSLKCDHELRHENDRIQAELLKNESTDVNLDAVSKITAQDFEDACNEELANFKFASIETDADKKKDKTSLNRSLQRHLVLVTKHKIGIEDKLLLPQGLRNDGETLRQTAERVLSEHCGPHLKVKFFGNAPCGFYKYKYPTEINGKVGAKVFFYYAKYEDGNVGSSGENKGNYEWLTRSELEGTLPERYRCSVEEFLVEEKY